LSYDPSFLSKGGLNRLRPGKSMVFRPNGG